FRTLIDAPPPLDVCGLPGAAVGLGKARVLEQPGHDGEMVATDQATLDHGHDRRASPVTLLPDHRPDEAHHDEEAGEHRDEPDPAVRRVGTLMRDELESDPKDGGPGEEQEAEDELRGRPAHEPPQ